MDALNSIVYFVESGGRVAKIIDAGQEVQEEVVGGNCVEALCFDQQVCYWIEENGGVGSSERGAIGKVETGLSDSSNIWSELLCCGQGLLVATCWKQLGNKAKLNLVKTEALEKLSTLTISLSQAETTIINSFPLVRSLCFSLAKATYIIFFRSHSYADLVAITPNLKLLLVASRRLTQGLSERVPIFSAVALNFGQYVQILFGSRSSLRSFTLNTA